MEANEEPSNFLHLIDMLMTTANLDLGEELPNVPTMLLYDAHKIVCAK